MHGTAVRFLNQFDHVLRTDIAGRQYLDPIPGMANQCCQLSGSLQCCHSLPTGKDSLKSQIVQLLDCLQGMVEEVESAVKNRSTFGGINEFLASLSIDPTGIKNPKNDSRSSMLQELLRIAKHNGELAVGIVEPARTWPQQNVNRY